MFPPCPPQRQPPGRTAAPGHSAASRALRCTNWAPEDRWADPPGAMGFTVGFHGVHRGFTMDSTKKMRCFINEHGEIDISIRLDFLRFRRRTLGIPGTKLGFKQQEW